MRRLFSIAFVVLAIFVATLKVAEWTSEEWWMNSLGFRSAQALYWQWRVEAFIPAFLIWTGVMVSNARLAWHNARWRDVSLPLLGPRALAGRNQISSEDRVRLDLLARRGEQTFIGMSALLCGMAAANQFDLWVLAFHPPAFGMMDSGANATFLVGVWPAMLWAWNAFGALLGFTLGLVITIAAFEGVLDFDTRGLRVGDATARHLAFLGGLILMWVGVRCGLAVLGEPVNFGWSANGISGFYEQTFTNPIRSFFLVSSPLLAFWFARTAPRHALRPIVVALFWSASALFFPLMAPSFGRAVRPASSPSLAKTLQAEQTQHIAFTRKAWGLDRVQEHQLNVETSDFLTSPETPLAPAGAVEKTPGLVVWPQEALRGALHDNDVGHGDDGDRSVLGRWPSELYLLRKGARIAARILETNPSEKTATSPLALESDPSRGGQVVATRHEVKAVILQSPVVRNSVFTRTPGLDPTDDGSAPPIQARVRELEANAKGGVARPNSLVGLTLALRFGDRSLLEGDKPVTWHLDPMERVQALAPFVWWTDAEPHPVWTRGEGEKSERLYWLVEGCFVSRSFPHAAMMPAGDEWSNVNYVRQSVLGVCDATTGETNFFLFDPSEPFSRAWNELLPGFFRPLSQLPAPLRAGTRLSPSLLNAQTVVWSRYHPAPKGKNEVEEWKKRSDEWSPFGIFDTSEGNTLVQQVLIERGGKPGLELLAAFASSLGKLTDSAVPVGSGEATRTRSLVALLSARDEGDAIWNGHGQTKLSAWRADKPIPLPSSESTSGALVSPLVPEFFDKFALVPLLDAKGDCVGMQISQGRAQRNKPKDGGWVLGNRVASTKTQFIPLIVPRSPVQINENMVRLRDLWKMWKDARANGQWKSVETIEKEINHILGP
ncbi:hypothetical protein IAD21_01907 [Abditibacteriota bacterium]|nr:hypothetical protein IAD21_01907 [Abditibacteriota bacterium]